jgi:hypothetical protein
MSCSAGENKYHASLLLFLTFSSTLEHLSRK